ncbi:MAG: pantetheine-phosphate adenylyltransferase [Clostridia bacterium]|nr:pantetheine-phosphate adenylyltransferase [Clostridia bacterium]
MKKGFIGGSFDPITVGHVDMIERASKQVDQLTVAILINKEKNCMFSLDERTKMARAALKNLKNVEITSFEGHMATYVLDNKFDVVFRGLRNASDFEYEIGLSQLYAKFYNGKCDTVYLMTKPEYSYICSNIVRQNFSLGADVSGWVPDSVLELMKKYSK